MATIKTNIGIEYIKGTIDKKTKLVMRVKKYRDPETGEVIAYGPNEYYALSARSTPLSEKQKQTIDKFVIISKQANEILHNPNHPRHKQLYELFLEQLRKEKPIKSFSNYIVSFLYQEIV